MASNQKINFVFFGSSRLSVIVLDELLKLNLAPSLVITTPAQPIGRKQILTDNIVKTWAEEHLIPVYAPDKLDRTFLEIFGSDPAAAGASVYLVASYGKIIPKSFLDLPPRGVLNIHPSLLPQYRGPAPMPTMMIDDCKETGISIMRIDEQMDHGPIVAVKNITIKEWPTYEELEETMAREGARLFAENIAGWIEGKIEAKEQDHSRATFTRKMTKEDGLLVPGDDPYLNFRKIQAYHAWPQAYFLHQSKDALIRVKVLQASFRHGSLIIEKVLPEGGKEMDYTAFVNGYGQAGIVTNQK